MWLCKWEFLLLPQLGKCHCSNSCHRQRVWTNLKTTWKNKGLTFKHKLLCYLSPLTSLQPPPHPKKLRNLVSDIPLCIENLNYRPMHSNTERDAWSASYHGCFTPNIHCTEGLSQTDTLEKSKISYPCQASNPNSQSSCLQTGHYTNWATPSSKHHWYWSHLFGGNQLKKEERTASNIQRNGTMSIARKKGSPNWPRVTSNGMLWY